MAINVELHVTGPGFEPEYEARVLPSRPQQFPMNDTYVKDKCSPLSGLKISKIEGI
jgi:hypothetical protein